MTVADEDAALNRLLDAALELPPQERDAWVGTLDAAHDGLKPRLRALLARAADVESRDFLGSLPLLPPDFAAGDASTTEAAGARIGPYRLERQIGAGGMGAVWLATRADGLFERTVALKLPHRGMFGADLAERMSRERSILAGLEHPNIARLYDAGLTADGQPYLALEFVEGIALDDYCRQHDCGVRERLRLFLQVADAVASAHARLIVHRDLKPANILVTSDGGTRLLDFGIAKLLDAPAEPGAARLTHLSVHALTPDYASPEQIRGEAVTTSSDIYSLGVVLFELLTGERPYRLGRDTRGALEDAILQAEPSRPSSVHGAHARELRGDLDTIVLKALHKSAAARYPTVNALADDIRRHLDGRPVQARPDGAWYRTSRFLWRNRLAAGATAIVAVALIAGATIATVGFIQARAAEKRALAEAQTSREVARFLVDLFAVSDPSEARGNSITAREILDRASTRISSELQTSPAIRAELQSTIADVYAKLGLYSEASKLALAALALRRAEGDPKKLADSLDRVGDVSSLLSHTREAAPLHQQALELRRRFTPRDHASIARTLKGAAVSRYLEQDFSASTELLAAARAELDQLASPDPAQLGEVIRYTAYNHHERSDYERAISLYREAVRVMSAGLGHENQLVASTLGDLAIALKDTRQFDEAERTYLESLAIQRKLLGNKHPDVGNSLNNLAVMYLDISKYEQALATAGESAAILRSALGEEHEVALIARQNVARAHTQLGHLEIAEDEYRKILAIRRRILAPDDLGLGSTLDALADVLNRQSHFAEAEPTAREAMSVMEQAVGRDHWRWAGLLRTYGTALTGQRRFAEAEVILLESYSSLRQKRGPAHRTTLLSAQRLADLYKAWNKTERMNDWLRMIAQAKK